MKVSISILVLIGIFSYGQSSPAARALDCTNLEDGKYPNPLDCTTFYKCSNGKEYLYDCALMANGEKLHFDEPTLQCEWPELARCAGDGCRGGKPGQLHGVIGCHGHAYGDLYPDPYDCGSFYQCAHGAGGTIEAHHKNCPSILHFNDEIKVCDWPENAGCKGCNPEPTQAPTDAPTQAPTQAPTEAPTQAPTQAPTDAPTQAPTDAPTQAPTSRPTRPPRPTTVRPTRPPRPTTVRPTRPPRPTTVRPTRPTRPTTVRPTRPTRPTTARPTQPPTEAPTQAPTQAPTNKPTKPTTVRPTRPTTVKSTKPPGNGSGSDESSSSSESNSSESREN